jgi:nucleoside-diphosphate-sugar epimerase
MKSRSVSLTGATGFLGGHIADACRRRGWRVRAIVRPGNRKPLPGDVDVREARLTSREDLASAFDGSEAVIHTAGLVRAARGEFFETVNVDGTRAVVEAANAAQTRLVHLSSLAAMGTGTADRPVREDDDPHPLNAYGRSKLAAEGVVRERARMPWIILRPCAVYGPGDRGFLPLARLARRGFFPLATSASTPFSFVYVEDLAAAVVSALDSAVSEEALFIAHARSHTAEALLRGLAHELARSYRPWRVPHVLLSAVAMAGDLQWLTGRAPLLDSARLVELSAEGFVCDVSRARERLGFLASVDLPEGLTRTVRWYRERGWL